ARGGEQSEYSGCKRRRRRGGDDRSGTAVTGRRGARRRRRRGPGDGPQDPRAADLPRPRRRGLRRRPGSLRPGDQPVHPLRRHPQGPSPLVAGRRPRCGRRTARGRGRRRTAPARVHRGDGRLRCADVGLVGQRGPHDAAARGL
ncbi:MAG: D-aminoacyl-tRNA deacylase, partial [uncultured Blastococcus sp.]